MNITVEEIITELEKMLMDGDSVYQKKLAEIINKLKNGYYGEINNLMSQDELIQELHMIGFSDLAMKLTWRGGGYDRFNR